MGDEQVTYYNNAAVSTSFPYSNTTTISGGQWIPYTTNTNTYCVDSNGNPINWYYPGKPIKKDFKDRKFDI